MDPYLEAFLAASALAVAGWIASVFKRDVSIVDSLWPLFFLVATAVAIVAAPQAGPRAWLLAALVSLWALRLCAYLTWRNWGQPEDRRYRAIRERNQPGFALKSLYLVFGLQALLATVIAAPIIAAAGAPGNLGAWDAAGTAIALAGIAWESIADLQLARFAAVPANAGAVMDRGLWRYSRHPNYFGECLAWWGIWLIAAAGGAAWTVFAPVLMTVLLLRVSGVALLERDIAGRRPGYRHYVQNTSAFVPWPPRTSRPGG
ncbi:MAG: DUF1295 domain-containing protein [Gammaproteobacteria bacterium]